MRAISKGSSKPALGQLRQKIIISLTEGPYLTPHRNVMNLITDSGFFEDAYSTEKIKSLFTFHLQPKAKKTIKMLFQREMKVEEDPNHYLIQPTLNSNSNEINIMKEDILCLKKERAEQQVTEDKLVTAIAELKHDSISMDFDEKRVMEEVQPRKKDGDDKGNCPSLF